jgi:hypothetical protein
VNGRRKVKLVKATFIEMSSLSRYSIFNVIVSGDTKFCSYLDETCTNVIKLELSNHSSLQNPDLSFIACVFTALCRNHSILEEL